MCAVRSMNGWKDADGNTVISGKLIDVSYANPKLDDVMLSITSVIDESDTTRYDKTRDDTLQAD